MSVVVIDCSTLIFGVFEKVFLPFPLNLAFPRAPNGRKHIVYTCESLYNEFKEI